MQNMRKKTAKARLDEMVQLVPDEKRVVAESLAKELAFMSTTMTKLKRLVVTHGPVDHFKQGKQDFLRDSPALKAYNTTIQRYGAIYKQLLDLVPKQTAEAASPLDDFLNEEA